MANEERAALVAKHTSEINQGLDQDRKAAENYDRCMAFYAKLNTGEKDSLWEEAEEIENKNVLEGYKLNTVTVKRRIAKLMIDRRYVFPEVVNFE